MKVHVIFKQLFRKSLLKKKLILEEIKSQWVMPHINILKIRIVFFSFSFLGDIGNLERLLSIETTSETYWALGFALLKPIEWPNGKGYVFPRLKRFLSNLAAAPYNALTKILGRSDPDFELNWFWCNWHFLRAAKKNYTSNHLMIPLFRKL